MKAKKTKDTFDLEILGGVVGLVIAALAVTAILDYENASVFFGVIVGMGSILNGLLAAGRFLKGHYILGILFGMIAVAMIALFVMQIMILKG